jgi:dTDP-4-dehydrorhamnose 3,5-epimerase
LKFLPQSIPDIFLIEPTLHGDHRGYFAETFRQESLEKAIGYRVEFVQDNESKSTKGVLRGLHYQLPPHDQSKLVRVIEGSVIDVVVDIRKASPTFGEYVSAVLTSDNKHQLFVPRGFAHGFVVLSDEAVFSYKVDNYYAPQYERGIAFDDNDLGINWQMPLSELQLSDKDKNHPSLANARELFE